MIGWGRGSHAKARRRLVLRARFQEHVLRNLWEAEKSTGDPLGSIRNLINDLGAVGVARILVDPQEVRNPPAGFIRLLNHGLARLTIEQAIVEFASSGIFTEAEVEAARTRLAIFRDSRGRQRHVNV